MQDILCFKSWTVSRTHEYLACESSARAPGTARGTVSEGGRSVGVCVREAVQLLRSTRCLAFAAGAIALVPSRLDLRGVDEQEDESKQREERPDTPHGPQARGPCLRASIMVGRPSGYGGFPYQRNTFCSRWRSSPMPPSRTSGLGPLAPPAPRCRGASAGTGGRSGGQVARSASMFANLSPASSASLKLGARAEITIT